MTRDDPRRPELTRDDAEVASPHRRAVGEPARQPRLPPRLAAALAALVRTRVAAAGREMQPRCSRDAAEISLGIHSRLTPD